MSGYTPGPWQIEWSICYADHKDVEFDSRQGKKSKGIKVGDELWRVPRVIGPVSAAENHWTGEHLDVEEDDARLIAAAPDLLEAAILATTYSDAQGRSVAHKALLSAIAKATGK